MSNRKAEKYKELRNTCCDWYGKYKLKNVFEKILKTMIQKKLIKYF